MWMKWRPSFTKRARNSGGENLPESTVKLNECYADIDTNNRWQGDIYPKESFIEDSLPNPKIPYWMLVNRTCHLYEGEGRQVKYPYLNFIAVLPVCEYAKMQNKQLKKAIPELVGSKLEGFLFLPSLSDDDATGHLVANFNLVHTFSLANSPKASDKLRQLSSPYCEYAFQRFSRFFYTVGYDDATIKNGVIAQAIVDECSSQDET